RALTRPSRLKSVAPVIEAMEFSDRFTADRFQRADLPAGGAGPVARFADKVTKAEDVGYDQARVPGSRHCDCEPAIAECQVQRPRALRVVVAPDQGDAVAAALACAP